MCAGTEEEKEHADHTICTKKVKELELKWSKERKERKRQAQLNKKLRKENEELEAKRKILESQIFLLTGGLGYETYRRVHMQINKQESDMECAVCMENQVAIELRPCKYQSVKIVTEFARWAQGFVFQVL